MPARQVIWLGWSGLHLCSEFADEGEDGVTDFGVRLDDVAEADPQFLPGGGVDFAVRGLGRGFDADEAFEALTGEGPHVFLLLSG